MFLIVYYGKFVIIGKHFKFLFKLWIADSNLIVYFLFTDKILVFNALLLKLPIQTRINPWVQLNPSRWSTRHIRTQFSTILYYPAMALSVSILNPSRYDWRGIRTSQFNNTSISMSIRTFICILWYIWSYQIHWNPFVGFQGIYFLWHRKTNRIWLQLNKFGVLCNKLN